MADKAAHQIYVAGKAGHQLPGLHLVEVGKGKGLDVGIELVAQVVGQSLRQQRPADPLSQGGQCPGECRRQHDGRAAPDGVHVARLDAIVDDIVQRAGHDQFHNNRHDNGDHQPQGDPAIGPHKGKHTFQ